MSHRSLYEMRNGDWGYVYNLLTSSKNQHPKREKYENVDLLPKPGSSPIIPYIPIFRLEYYTKCIFYLKGSSLRRSVFASSHREVKDGADVK